jgi:hypothetical protein
VACADDNALGKVLAKSNRATRGVALADDNAFGKIPLQTTPACDKAIQNCYQLEYSHKN